MPLWSRLITLHRNWLKNTLMPSITSLSEVSVLSFIKSCKPILEKSQRVDRTFLFKRDLSAVCNISKDVKRNTIRLTNPFVNR